MPIRLLSNDLFLFSATAPAAPGTDMGGLFAFVAPMVIGSTRSKDDMELVIPVLMGCVTPHPDVEVADPAPT